MDELFAAKVFNLTIPAAVVISGLYWLKSLDQKWREEYRFLYRAYVCWWFAWLQWVITWTIILTDFPAPDTTISQLLVFATSDLNMILFIMVYFTLTRANEFRLADALRRSAAILVALILSIVALYLFFGEAGRELQKQWELCLGIVTTMLLGWAFSLRFNSKVVLIVGFVYGFCQPFAYHAIFVGSDKHAAAASLVVLAFMKIVLATVGTRFFILKPPTTHNLVLESTVSSSARLFWSWGRELTMQTVGLATCFIVLFVFLLPQPFSLVAQKLGQIAGFLGILIAMAKLWSYVAPKLFPDEPAEKKRKARTKNNR